MRWIRGRGVVDFDAHVTTDAFSSARLNDPYKSLCTNPHEEFLDDPPWEEKGERRYQAMRVATIDAISLVRLNDPYE